MIKCTHCGVEKPEQHFYATKKQCKYCYCLIRRTDKTRAIDRERKKTPENLEHERLRGLRRGEDPEELKKRRTRSITNRLIRDGHMTRGAACEQCGKECKAWANQKKNDNPRDVIWLCPICNNICNDRTT